jgi:uncharacterized protein (TIGR02270 family)
VQRISRVLDAGTAAPELQRALISALGWPSFGKVTDVAKEMLLSERPEVRRVGIGAHAVHRIDPGAPLPEALSDSDAQLRARALKAAAELGRVDLVPVMLQGASDRDDVCRFFAAWSAARLGSRTALVIEVLRNAAEASVPYAQRALDMALRCMELPEARNWLQGLWQTPQRLRLAAIGTGILGDTALVGDLIAIMDAEPVARVAGEAFSMITGADLSYEDLEKGMPEGFEAGPTEEPADDNVALDPDENLPWPEPRLVAKSWQERRKDFPPGVRYLGGKEISTAALQDTLSKGKQRQGAAAALELGLRAPSQPLFEVRAPGWRQTKSLGT